MTRGEEGGQASTLQADSVVRLQATTEGSLVSYHSEVMLTGRLGRFALGVMKKKAQSLGEEFAANLRRRLDAVAAPAVEAPAPAPQPPSAPEAAPARARPRWWRAPRAWMLGRRTTPPKAGA